MLSYLKQSTASQTRIVGPFVDDTDFTSAETGLTIANTDVKLSKNGGSSANKNSGGGTHIANGMYALTFDATDTATVGELSLSISVSGALLVVAKFVVLEEAVYDALFGASATGKLPATLATADVSGNLPADVIAVSGDSTAADNLEAAFDGTGFGFTGCTMPAVTTLTGHTPQTGDSFARIGANGVGLTVVTGHLTDIKGAGWASTDNLAEIGEDVFGLDGDAMRGTDGAALASEWTAGRAVYIDNLSAGAVAQEASVATLTNAVRNQLVIPTEYQLPSSGSERFRLVVITYDSSGALNDPDSNTITIEVENAAGTDRSGNLYDAASGGSASTTMTRVSTGRYELFYEVDAADAEEQLNWIADYDEGSVAMLGAGQTTIVAIASGGGFNSTDRTYLTAAYNKLPSSDYLTGTASADGSGYSTHSAANVRTEIDANSTKLAAIVEDTDEMQTGWDDLTSNATNTYSDLTSLIGTVGIAGAGLAAIPWNASWDAEVQSECEDALGVVVGSAGANLTGIPWNASWDAEVRSECIDAMVLIHLDHLFASDYNPASKPGVATALMNELIVSDSGVSQFSTNALENAPGGGGGGGDATEAKQDTIIDHLTEIKGVGFATGTHSLVEIRSNLAGGGDTLTLPDVSEVKLDIVYGYDSTPLTGSYDPLSCSYPAAGDVRDGVDRGDGTLGTIGLPAQGQVQFGVGYGADDTELTGTLQVSSSGSDSDSIEFVRGDDYIDDSPRGPQQITGLDFELATGSGETYALKLVMVHRDTGQQFTFEGATVPAANEPLERVDDDTVTWRATAAQTLAMSSGRYRFDLQVTRETGAVGTAKYGEVIVKQTYTDP